VQHLESGETGASLSVQSPPTWTDPQTGLEWQMDSPGRMTWDEAMAYADVLSLNGKDDWRLPKCAELESLLDRSVYRPAMRNEVPFRDTRSYWSSSTFGGKKNSAWMVMLDGAYVLSYFKTNAYHIRCVRG
jgi:formylglycine-generating enzyme required for sulfatase activity